MGDSTTSVLLPPFRSSSQSERRRADDAPASVPQTGGAWPRDHKTGSVHNLFPVGGPCVLPANKTVTYRSKALWEWWRREIQWRWWRWWWGAWLALCWCHSEPHPYAKFCSAPLCLSHWLLILFRSCNHICHLCGSLPADNSFVIGLNSCGHTHQGEVPETFSGSPCVQSWLCWNPAEGISN